MGDAISKAVFKLYERTATDLPRDVEQAIAAAKKRENTKNSKETLQQILDNVRLARKICVPICQDTGTPLFYIDFPEKSSQILIKKSILKATDKATISFLRKNSVDTLSSKPIGNTPIMHFKPWNKDYIRITLILKGAGSENMTRMYKLPEINLNAERNLEGVEKCVVNAVFKAQGAACPPYIIGVCIGGDSETGISEAKKQLLRKIDDNNKNSILKKLEESLLKKLNKLGIGPAGLGGKNTALSVKATSIPRHPGSYFVTVVFSCWALRRYSLELKGNKIKIY